MTAKESLLSTSKQRRKKDQGATPEEALEAINSYYENISDDQFAEDVRGACADYEEGSIESPPIRTEEENSGHRSSVKRSL
jgi:hypothetical protein